MLPGMDLSAHDSAALQSARPKPGAGNERAEKQLLVTLPAGIQGTVGREPWRDSHFCASSALWREWEGILSESLIQPATRGNNSPRASDLCASPCWLALFPADFARTCARGIAVGPTASPSGARGGTLSPRVSKESLASQLHVCPRCLISDIAGGFYQNWPPRLYLPTLSRGVQATQESSGHLGGLASQHPGTSSSMHVVSCGLGACLVHSPLWCPRKQTSGSSPYQRSSATSPHDMTERHV